MLILTSRLGEALFIGEKWEVEVRVLGIKGNQVRLGVSAPDSYKIDREVVMNRKKADNDDDFNND